MRSTDQSLTRNSSRKQNKKCGDLTSLLFVWLSTLILISESAMAIPVNYLQFYVDEPQPSLVNNPEVGEVRKILLSRPPTLIIFDPSNNGGLRKVGEMAEEELSTDKEEQQPQQIINGSSFTKRRINSPLQTALLADTTRLSTDSKSIARPQKLMRIERNFHSNHGADAKMFQINTVSDLPMFRFG